MSEEVVDVTARLQNAPEAEWDDIEWRVDSSPYERDGKWSARFVPYLKAHSVARLLDEWVGADAWSDEYHTTPAGRGLECHLTILGVTKIDVGVAPSGSDDQLVVKGVYSDAFKRVASIKWGVGRNVYQLEGVWAPVKVIDKDGKKTARATDESLEVLKRIYDQRPM